MLRTNLSSRPFYNERAVRVGIGVIVLLTAALSAFNAAQILSLNSRNSELVSQAEGAEAKARDLREQAGVTRQALDREDVDAVQAAAKEANQLIDRRAFSWTDLFNRFEETLPPDVRIVAVAPQVDNEGQMLVAVTVVARRVEHLDQLIERLEQTGAFSGVISRQEEVQEDGTLRSVIQGYYQQSGRSGAAVSPPPASDPSGTAKPATNTGGNQPQKGVGERKPQIDTEKGKPQIDADTRRYFVNPGVAPSDVQRPGFLERRGAAHDPTDICVHLRPSAADPSAAICGEIARGGTR